MADNEIKEHVQQRYGQRARQVSQLTLLTPMEAACCADGTAEKGMDKSLGAYSDLYVQEIWKVYHWRLLQPLLAVVILRRWLDLNLENEFWI